MKLILLTEPEIFFMPNLAAKLAREECLQSIVLYLKPQSFASRRKAVFRNFYFLGPRGSFYVLLDFWKAWNADQVHLHRFYSIKKVAGTFKVPFHKITSLYGETMADLLGKTNEATVFAQVGVKIRPELLAQAYFINKHCSPLPAYAGVYPVFWAMLKRESEFGVSIHEMNAEYDAGKILRQARIPRGNHSFFSAYHTLYDLSAELILNWLKQPELELMKLSGVRSYFSFPKLQDCRQFRAANNHLGRPFRLHPEIK